MELPKNITQIGEVSKDCKLYVEDYVVSYMKQLNQTAQDKGMAVALYGRREEEGGVSYHFVYGACRLDFLQREVRHLSQAQQQEIEKLRKKYFPELVFMGYRILNGEMIEGIHLCEQDICRYIGGYARFYEKNDAMLAYMLDAREQAEPEKVDQTKYEEVKKRQEERRSALGYSEKGSVTSKEQQEDAITSGRVNQRTHATPNLQKMRLAAVGAFALLCLLGIGTFREDELMEASETGGEVAAVSGTETLLMEDKLEQALLEENQQKEPDVSDMAAQSSEPEPSVQETTAEQSQVAEEDKLVEQPIEQLIEQELPTEENGLAEDQVPTESLAVSEDTTIEAVAYIIQPGDTLIDICLRQYGSDAKMLDVCKLNEISDPDDIKEGQVIMLPR